MIWLWKLTVLPVSVGMCTLDKLDIWLRQQSKGITDTSICTILKRVKWWNAISTWATGYSHSCVIFLASILTKKTEITRSQAKQQRLSTILTSTGKMASPSAGHGSLSLITWKNGDSVSPRNQFHPIGHEKGWIHLSYPPLPPLWRLLESPHLPSSIFTSLLTGPFIQTSPSCHPM
jgi:hypothetical protein